jgi:hypothetical protein
VSGEAIYLELLAEALLWLMLLGSGFTLLVGLLLLLAPQRIIAQEQRFNSWISLRRSLKPLEQPRNIDARLYRLHRPLGLFILLSCAYILYQLAFHYEARVVGQLFAGRNGADPVSEWLAEALLLIGLLLNTLLILFGALLALQPSRLKGFESWANRWVSTRRGMEQLERPYHPVDTLAGHHPRLLGALILLFSLNNLYFFLLQILKESA